MKYLRIVDVAMVMSDDHGQNQCTDPSMAERGSTLAKTWEEVPQEVTDADPFLANIEQANGEITGTTSAKKIRLCMKRSDEAVIDDDENTFGVCGVMISRGESCEDNSAAGLDWRPFPVGGSKDKNGKTNGVLIMDANLRINLEGDNGNLYLCYTYEGCEDRPGTKSAQRSEDLDGRGFEVKKAISDLATHRQATGQRPKDRCRNGRKVWQSGAGVTGNLLQDEPGVSIGFGFTMPSAKVFLFEESAR